MGLNQLYSYFLGCICDNMQWFLFQINNNNKIIVLLLRLISFLFIFVFLFLIVPKYCIETRGNVSCFECLSSIIIALLVSRCIDVLILFCFNIFIRTHFLLLDRLQFCLDLFGHDFLPFLSNWAIECLWAEKKYG